MDNRKIYSDFKSFLKNLDESLFRDKVMKINFFYELDISFKREDLGVLKSSVNAMINNLEDIRKELR